MILQKPDTQLKFILHYLINSTKGISERDTNFNMFRGYISIIRRSIPSLKFTEVPFKNVFGHKGKFRRHWLTDTDKKKAVRLYKSMCK